jgi:hypothetical protein
MAMSNMKMLALQGQGRGGIVAGLMASGMSAEEAGAQATTMASPGYWQNLQLQSQKGRMEDRAEETARRKRDAPSFTDKLAESNSVVRAAKYGVSSLSTGVDEMLTGISAGFADSRAESAANKSGQTRIRTPDDLFAASAEETIRIRALKARGPDEEMPAGSGLGGSAALFRTPGGKAIGRFAAVAAVRNDLGGDAFSLAQFRERQGGLKGALGGGHIEFGARLLGGATGLSAVASALGADFVGGEEVTAAQRKEAGVAEATNKDLNASALMLSDASKALDTGLGADRSNAAKAAYAESLAASAKEKYSFFGSGKLEAADKEKAMAAAAKAGGLSEREVGAFGKQIETASMQNARDLAGKTGLAAFEGSAAVAKDDIVGSIDDIKNRRTELGEKRMGETSFGFAMGLGDAKKQSQAMDVLYGGDADTGLLVSLYAAMREDGDNKEAAARWNQEIAKPKYRTPKGQQKIKDARVRYEANPKVHEQLAAAGKSYGKEKDAGAAFEQDASAALQQKQDVQAGSGKRALFKDSSLVDLTKMTEHGILKKLSTDEGMRSKVDPELAKMAVAYGKADDKGKQRLANQLLGKELSKSTVTPEELTGGAVGAKEPERDAESDDIAATGSDALAQFPDAVRTFSEASKALQAAAEHLGNATKMGDSVNFSIF